MRSSFYARTGKRVLDVAGSLLLLLVLSPLFLLIAVAIKLDSRGPVFYRHERIGRGGRPFMLVKFRSMVVGAERKGAGILVEKNDTRITRVGRVIRKLSLDELPQLFNILRGDMSIVGPRPGMRYQYEQYDRQQARRLLVRPGVTGWAQVNGRNAINWEERIRRDLEYVERLSLPMDLWIVIRTVPAVLSGADQIADADYWKNRARQREQERREGAAASAPSRPETGARLDG